MSSLEKYYKTKLYPLQDGALKIVKDLKLPFYLTGGTALSRFYYQHRYSDDLDLFVNNDSNFKIHIRSFFDYLNSPAIPVNFKLNTERTNVGENFAQFFIYDDEIELKIDFVNDLAVRFGSLVEDDILGKVDSVRNILSNKISALYRFAIKDYVDVWIIAKNYKFNWREIFSESKQKEATVDPVEIFNLFKSFPFENLNAIKWAQKFDFSKIEKEFDVIAQEILNGSDNSLA